MVRSASRHATRAGRPRLTSEVWLGCAVDQFQRRVGGRCSRNRRGHEPATPGEPVFARVETGTLGHAFRAGSRIRIWVDASSTTGEFGSTSCRFGEESDLARSRPSVAGRLQPLEACAATGPRAAVGGSSWLSAKRIRSGWARFVERRVDRLNEVPNECDSLTSKIHPGGGSQRSRPLTLMEARLSPLKHRMPRGLAGILVDRGGGGPGGCATRGQTLIRGSAAAGPGFVVRARCLKIERGRGRS
jgi:X-Pro dipeptidyl-peptidase C-terminal non-catalytic domain